MKSENNDAPASPVRRRLIQASAGLAAGLKAPLAAASAAAPRVHSLDTKLRQHVKHIVVIYLENRSFNNLFADFPGTAFPMTGSTSAQRDRDGSLLAELPVVWGGMVPSAQNVGGKEYLVKQDQIRGLPNAPWILRDAQGEALPEAVITRDLTHRFYQNQAQINGGKNDGFVAWGDTGALVMAHYGSTREQLGLWQLARQYTLCDNFFMAAYGGSYLNHQFLVAGRPNEYLNAADTPARKHIAETADGPQGRRLALDEARHSPSAMDGKPVYRLDGAITPDGYVVNTMAPPYQPSYVRAASGGDARLADPDDPSTLPPQTYATIGDLLSDKGIDWAFYAGAWDAALSQRGGGHKPNFQSHHQPFNYFARFAPGTTARARHLRDAGTGESPLSNHFIGDAVAGRLPPVSFYKPQGNLNLHAGYSEVESGDQHLANVIEHLRKSPQWKEMVVVVTFDENGGWWDHVAPPPGDRWGPGSRVPALVVSPFAKRGAIDHSFYDTTSILRLITRRFELPLLEGLAARNAAFASRGARPPADLTAALRFPAT